MFLKRKQSMTFFPNKVFKNIELCLRNIKSINVFNFPYNQLFTKFNMINQ